MIVKPQANIYAFLEDDDRVGLVLKYIDDAIHELDGMDTLVSSYKIHLNVRGFKSVVSVPSPE